MVGTKLLGLAILPSSDLGILHNADPEHSVSGQWYSGWERCCWAKGSPELDRDLHPKPGCGTRFVGLQAEAAVDKQNSELRWAGLGIPRYLPAAHT